MPLIDAVPAPITKPVWYRRPEPARISSAVIARIVVDLVDRKGMNARVPADGIDCLACQVNGHGRVIVIDSTGNCHNGLAAREMVPGRKEAGCAICGIRAGMACDNDMSACNIRKRESVQCHVTQEYRAWLDDMMRAILP